MTALPEPPAAPAAGQTANALTDAVIQAAVENAIEQAKLHGTTPQAVIGTAPPVPQPGIPPMSSKAVDDAVRLLAAGAASLPVGGMTALILYIVGHADPTSLAIGAAAPISLAIPVLALARLLRRAKDAAPPVIHQTYEGTVYQDQRNVHSETTGVIVKNTNQQ
jgi:hypothetical protein